MILNLYIENSKQMFALMFDYCCNKERLQVLSCCPNVCNNEFLLCFPPKRAHNFIRNILNAFLSILWIMPSFDIFHEIRIKLKCFLHNINTINYSTHIQYVCMYGSWLCSYYHNSHISSQKWFKLHSSESNNFVLAFEFKCDNTSNNVWNE